MFNRIYLITVFEKLDPPDFGAVKFIGQYQNFAKARRIVERNKNDIAENRKYHYALIEGFKKGLLLFADKKFLFSLESNNEFVLRPLPKVLIDYGRIPNSSG